MAAWKLVSADGKTLAKGEFAAKTIPLGRITITSPDWAEFVSCQPCDISASCAA